MIRNAYIRGTAQAAMDSAEGELIYWAKDGEAGAARHGCGGGRKAEDDREVRWRPVIGCGKQPKKRKNEDSLNLSLNPNSKRAHL